MSSGRVRHSISSQVQTTFVPPQSSGRRPRAQQHDGPGDTNLSMPLYRSDALRIPQPRHADDLTAADYPKSKSRAVGGAATPLEPGAAAVAPADANLSLPAYRSYARESASAAPRR